MDKKRQKKLRHKKQRLILAKIVSENPRAQLVENKYKVIAGMIQKYYPQILGRWEQEYLAEICDDIIAANREWQWATEGKDKKNKARLEQEFFQGRMKGN